ATRRTHGSRLAYRGAVDGTDHITGRDAPGLRRRTRHNAGHGSTAFMRAEGDTERRSPWQPGGRRLSREPGRKEHGCEKAGAEGLEYREPRHYRSSGISTRNSRPSGMRSNWRRYSACAKPLIGRGVGSPIVVTSCVFTASWNI